jgi:membrane protein insertase Oxa1/YidC/SpoIIIJ
MSKNLEEILLKLKNTVVYFRNILLPIFIISILMSYSNANTTSSNSIGLVYQLGYIKSVLTQIGPILSAVLFILAGVFYSLGQLLTPEKKATFHTTAINLIIGAIIVAILSFASTGLAVASTHLLSNSTLKG